MQRILLGHFKEAFNKNQRKSVVFLRLAFTKKSPLCFPALVYSSSMWKGHKQVDLPGFLMDGPQKGHCELGRGLHGSCLSHPSFRSAFNTCLALSFIIPASVHNWRPNDHAGRPFFGSYESLYQSFLFKEFSQPHFSDFQWSVRFAIPTSLLYLGSF